MEARDLGNTISLYLPQADGSRQPYAVLQERHRVGAFASQEEAIGFALDLAGDLHRRQGVPVRLRVEQVDGAWTTTDALGKAPASVRSTF
ncbi:hypothetical protein L2Y96_21870 [Luteibacter aegosomaticola]|uniref:hypothetical protein n=1 Tax=Luteibacter aegosomaticola TaxID=2911538 RepID=UPI001FF9FF5B|nr:hypothetical protein [Luteibacter aegosomaticola]UPG89993.1 hypothetical protein L2Y96_21870 [Luteibacter aegosomaticola]